MILNLENKKLKIDSLLRGKSVEKKLSVVERATLEFIHKWLKNKDEFVFRTSGSTGKPKEIQLSRKLMEYSARETLSFLEIGNGGNSLLCISPVFIGGAMMIVRSLLNHMQMEVITPSTKIDPKISEFDLVSLVPMQLQWIADNNMKLLDSFRYVLIGGAGIHPSLEHRILESKPSATLYATYGMTETASHVALRALGTKDYVAIGDVAFGVDEEDCLKMKGTITNNTWLRTNDIANIESSRKFELRGRRDFVINSGGIKVSPEYIERLLAPHIRHPFVVSSVPDQKLGEKIVLILEGDPIEFNLDAIEIERYLRPKEIFFVRRLCFLESGKIDRKANRDLVLGAGK